MIQLFSKNGCKNCDIAKNVLIKQNIEHEIIQVKSLGNAITILDQQSFDIDSFSFTGFPFALHNNAILSFDDIINTFSEPILMPQANRFSMYPIKYTDIYEMYKKARASYWQPEEISLIKDISDLQSLNKNEKHFIYSILAFFAASDGIVNENLNINFSKEIEIPEVRAFYALQEAIEAIHSETYSILLDKYVQDPNEKSKLQNAIHTIPAIKKKAEWALKFMHKDNSFAKRLFAFACVEGIYFSGSFCAIFWLKKRNLLPGLSFSNELISRDEGLHTEFALLLYSKLKFKLSQEELEEIVIEAVANEKEFITESIPVNLIGMNQTLMTEYIEFVADRLVSIIGYSKIYNTKNPFDFMETISLNGKTNFFEKRVAEYSKAGVMNNAEDDIFDLDSDF